MQKVIQIISHDNEIYALTSKGKMYRRINSKVIKDFITGETTLIDNEWVEIKGI